MNCPVCTSIDVRRITRLSDMGKPFSYWQCDRCGNRWDYKYSN